MTEMAGSPDFKVYTSGGEYVAACKYASDAARLCSPGMSVRHGHQKRWTIFVEPDYDANGGKEWAASFSWDAAAEIMHQNVDRLLNGQRPVLTEPFPWEEPSND